MLGKKRSEDEILRYALILGGIPHYLNAINLNESFEQNMNQLFFTSGSPFINEYKRIFYSQFKEYRTYEIIANNLKDRPMTLGEVADKLKMPSGGGVKSYLDNLKKALLIDDYIPYNKNEKTKLKKYKLTDEYLRFYFKYIAPNRQLIQNNQTRNLFNQLVKPKWEVWLGYAFENFCFKNALRLAEKMGFSDYVMSWGPYFHKGDPGFQIDLLFLRSDHVITLCEIKYTNQAIPINVVHDVERKCNLIKLPRGYMLEKALISRFGASDPLLELGYFHHILTQEDLF